MNPRLATTFLLIVVLWGCDGDGSARPGAPLLLPYAGSWRFDVGKTLALWDAQGVPPSLIDRDRVLAEPSLLHPDMTIEGNVAVLPGMIVDGEYDFFALHEHGQWLCGKAWHHEDRLDHGDMSKCYVRLELRGQELHLSVRMQDGPPRLDDPDLVEMPPTAGAPGTCPADAAPSPPWTPWMTYVFVRDDPEGG